ncbi:MAG: hypothetical protein IT368_03795 [Candidatus Hydrogenedentes bacterium]|nr:hypothetical protein [Candidatus Hydrogenedentota bacterium]
MKHTRALTHPRLASHSDTPRTDFAELTAYIISTITLGIASIFNKTTAS